MGALAGAGVGWALRQSLNGGGDDRLARLEASIRHLQERVAALERAPRAEAQAEVTRIIEQQEPAAAGSADTVSHTLSPVVPQTSPQRRESPPPIQPARSD